MFNVYDSYRRINFPECPYCNIEYDLSSNDSQSISKLISGENEDCVIECPNCRKKYRVTATIQLHTRVMRQ